jgi:shikimate dehydrogenase
VADGTENGGRRWRIEEDQCAVSKPHYRIMTQLLLDHAFPISAKTTLVGLIGWPVGHSVSPAMHNAAFAALELDWRYVPLPVDPIQPDAVRDAVRGMRALGMAGINVTVPHKQAVLPFLDHIAPAAQAIRAVNTIIVAADGSLTGDNTDAPGFIADLRAHGVEPAGRRVLVLGAGGSARAIVYGLAQAGAHHITVANRSVERAEQLLNDLRPFLGATTGAVVALLDGLAEAAAGATLVVNCTSLGMTPRADTTPWPVELPLRPDQIVYDLVYNPADTLLLQQARARGAQAIGGLGMLIWQGALAFEQWTGQPAPVATMRAAAEEQMRRRAANT